jgi:hypothetical protein
MENIVVNRKELYELVWSEPMLSLSNRFGMPGREIRKICERLNIPLPKAGYWQKIQHNKPVLVKPLPEYFTGDERVELGPSVTGKQEKPPAVSVSPKSQMPEAGPKKNLPIIVPAKLSTPDPLIQAAKESLTRGTGRRYQHGGLVWTKGDQLDIRVAPKSVGRAIRFMNALLKLLKSRGHDIQIEYGSTYVVIEMQRIEIQLKEKMTRVNVVRTYSNSSDTWIDSVYQATGLFALRINGISEREWRDGRLPLEGQLEAILERLEAEAEKMHLQQIKRDKWQEEQQEKQRVERELKERKEKDLAAFNELLDQAQRWQQTKVLREYLGAVESKLVNAGKMSEEKVSWLQWAIQKANELDPL